MIALTLSWQLRYMATHAHVHWRAEQATLANTFGAFIGCILVRECLNYLVHRANHSKLLYKLVHEAHHRIPACHGGYDGLYAGPLDTIQAVVVVFSPIALLPSIHLLAVRTLWPCFRTPGCTRYPSIAPPPSRWEVRPS